MKAKEFLENKGIKDTLFIDGNWVKGELSKLLDEYNKQMECNPDEEWIDEDDIREED